MGQPTLTISCAHPSTSGTTSQNFYVAGDVVRGTVKYNGRAESVSSVSIVFTGKLTVGLHDSSNTSDRLTSTLFEFSTKAGKGTVNEWPFSFQLPDAILVTPDKQTAPRHVPSSPQELLPSFRYDDVTKIEYQITASIEYKGALFARKASAKEIINISAAPLEKGAFAPPSASDHTFSLTSHRLRPGQEHVIPTVLERFSSFLGAVNREFGDPRILVSLRTTLPNALHLASKIPISLSVNFLPESEGISNPPKIYIVKLEVKLHITTKRHVGSNSKEQTSIMDLFIKKWDSKTNLIDYGDQNKLDITDSVSDAFVHDVENKLVPTFTTANLRRSYSLSMEVWLECVGETWKKTFERDVYLLPAKTVYSPPGTNLSLVAPEKPGLPQNSIQNDANYDAPPPNYDEVQHVADLQPSDGKRRW